MSQSSQATGQDRTGYVVVRSGFCSEQGSRAANEDFAAVADKSSSRFGVVAAIADGVGGAKGGRVAAELTVRGFIDGCLGNARHLLPKDSSARSLEDLNR